MLDPNPQLLLVGHPGFGKQRLAAAAQPPCFLESGGQLPAHFTFVALQFAAALHHLPLARQGRGQLAELNLGIVADGVNADVLMQLAQTVHEGIAIRLELRDSFSLVADVALRSWPS